MEIQKKSSDYISQMEKELVTKDDTLLYGNKLEKALSFWRNNFHFLLKPQVVIFTSVVNNFVSSTEVLSIMKQLVKLSLLDKVKALFPLTNKAYTFIEFMDEASAVKFQSQSEKIGNISTAFVNNEPPVNYVNIFIEKLPCYIIQEYLPALLAQWGEIVSITPTFMKLLNGITCETGSSKVKFKLKKGCSYLDLPYFVKLDRLKTYLHIPSRPKICFRCNAKDHLVSNCLFKYCRSCKSYKEPQHTCQTSYAQKVSTSLNLWQSSLIQAQEDCLIESIESQLEKEEKKVECLNLLSKKEVTQSLVKSNEEINLKVDHNDMEEKVKTKASADIQVDTFVGNYEGEHVVLMEDNEMENGCVQMEEDIAVVADLLGSSGNMKKKRLANENLSNKSKKKQLIGRGKQYAMRNKPISKITLSDGSEKDLENSLDIENQQGRNQDNDECGILQT